MPKMINYLKAYKGDTARYVQTTSRAWSVMQASCLVLAPLLAKLSEAYGRRPLMLLGSRWALASRLVDATVPHPLAMVMTTACAGVSNATLHSLMAATGDLFAADGQAALSAMGGLHIGAMLASIAAPGVGSLLAARDARLSLAVGVALSSLEVALVTQAPETLPLDRQRPLMEAKLQDFNPLAFLELFAKGPRMAMLCLTQVAASIIDSGVVRSGPLVYRESLGWSVARVGRYTMSSAIVAVLGNVAAGGGVAALGPALALLAGTLSSTLQHALNSMVTKSWQQWGVMQLGVPAGMKTGGLSALIFQAGQDIGMRREELQNHLQAMDSFAGAIGAPIMARWYVVALRAGKSRIFFRRVAAVALLQAFLGLLASGMPRQHATAPCTGASSSCHWKRRCK